MVERIIDLSIKHRFLVLITLFITLIASIYAIKKTSLDALPDLSPAQVIIQIKWEGQSPKLIEDQISYPLVSNLLSLPDISTVRAMSSFENGLIYVIFKDGTDLYKARDRILEKLSELAPTFPKSAKVTMGPDATGVGWAYEYALKSDTKSLDELRDLQEYYYKYALLGVDGVSEVATIGGFSKQFEITLDQDKMAQYGVSLGQVKKAIQRSNNDSGGRMILENGFEHIITAKGYQKALSDVENITIKSDGYNIIKLSDIADLTYSPKSRRGVADLDGEGEVVGGIVVVRFGENPYKVIKAVKEKLKSLKVDGVEVAETYDRSSLIDKAIDTLKHTLLEESIIVLVVTALFLFHIRSSLIMLITLPITVMITFLLMYIFGIGSNIMSLGGIAIAIGAMVDATIVMVENAHKYLNRLQREGREISDKMRFEAIIKSAKLVGRPIFFALVLVVVSFLPIFALAGQEGKLFTPLAFTKTFAMVTGALLSITLVPILMIYFIKGNIPQEEKNPINRLFQAIYTPILMLSLKFRYLIFIGVIGFVLFGYYLYQKQNWEFMPMMNEQTFMYMPVTPYGIGADFSKELLQKSDRVLKSFPEVKSVFGKAGRADTATDPAPLAMIETIVTFKPKSKWRKGMDYKKLMDEMDKKLQIPGLINSWTYPIRGRIDMLLTGIRTPLGIKLYGSDHDLLADKALEIEKKLQELNATLSVSSDKINSGYYLNIDIDEEKLAKYGITKQKILDTISYGVAGARVSTLYKDIKRYPVILRYDSTQRGDITALKELRVDTPFGFFPLREFADISYDEGASVIKSEKGLGVNFIYITPKNGVTPSEYKKRAEEKLKEIKLPEGYYYEWAGQSEYLESAMERLKVIIPLVLIVLFVLIYLAFHNLFYATIIFLTLPIALVGGIYFIEYLHINLSVAVVVGFIALLGVAAETSIVMLLYLDEAYKERKKEESLTDIVKRGAVLRLRPKLMTVFAILGGLVPILFISGVGNEVMRAIAVPMIGGMVSSALLTLIVIPALFYHFKRNRV